MALSALISEIHPSWQQGFSALKFGWPECFQTKGIDGSPSNNRVILNPFNKMYEDKQLIIWASEMKQKSG